MSRHRKKSGEFMQALCKRERQDWKSSVSVKYRDKDECIFQCLGVGPSTVRVIAM